MEYAIVTASNRLTIELLVNEKIQDGYILAGHLIFNNNDGTFYQPMIKEYRPEARFGGKPLSELSPDERLKIFDQWFQPSWMTYTRFQELEIKR
jgi:hypothetical protein